MPHLAITRPQDRAAERHQGALDAHNHMSTQALSSITVQGGLKDILLNHAGLYETLCEQAASP
jgi:hypothetical protein